MREAAPTEAAWLNTASKENTSKETASTEFSPVDPTSVPISPLAEPGQAQWGIPRELSLDFCSSEP